MKTALTTCILCVLAASLAPAAQLTAIPRPEHPDPQRFRDTWLNLNGEWNFFETDDDSDLSPLERSDWPDTIVVPFCRESRLSGLGRRGFVRNVWYRLHGFQVPKSWAGRRIRLHIGACDWATTVWLNGNQLGTIRRGSSPLTFELTDHLRPDHNTLIIRAFDDTRSGLQQLGKQSDREESHGIFYTRTTGVWQTVWLEAVGSTFIDEVRYDADPANSRVTIHADLDGTLGDLTLEADATLDGRPVGKAATRAAWRHNQLVLPLSESKLWSVESPTLYDLTLTLKRGDEIIDTLRSYFGLRTIEVRGPLFLINGKPVFQRLVLDQGFYPDGIWTAPSDEALRGDIELSKAAGFNGARLHQKIFEPRFHYWADRLGYLTWGETPSFGANYGDARVNLPIIDEWVAIVRRDRNHPSIIGWCPFNETPAEAGPIQNTVVELTRALDPSRPWIETSGWVKSHPDPDVDCRHDYDQNPESLAARYQFLRADLSLPPQYGIRGADRPFFLSEFGGIGWIPEGREGWGYGSAPKSLDEFYARYDGLLAALQKNRFMFGFCYTQLTDVEQECNGIYYYDRSPKFDMKRIHDLTARPAAFETDPPPAAAEQKLTWHTLLSAAVDEAPAWWRYTLESPPDGWNTPEFDDEAWQQARGGFGRKEGWQSRIATPWSTPDIWLRAKFVYDGAAFDSAQLILHYDNATRIWINGRPILALEGWNDAYAAFDVTEPLRSALKQGANVIAIHTHQDTGGQYIDAALLLGSR